MVSGTLALKNGYYYAVLSYQDAAGKRHQKWVSTGLPQKGNKCRAEQEFIRIRSEFEIPPAAGELNSNMLFADYLDQWLEIVKGTRLELPVLVAAFYGFRRGEVLGLKWDAIDFERGTITIRHTVTSLQVDGKTKMYAQDSAKTKSSMRTLPLVGSFAEYFKEVKAAQEVNKKVCGNCYNYEYDGYVFVDELGDLMRPEYLTSYFPQYI